MSAVIGNAKDKNGNTFYPITKTNAVIDNNNIDVETRISAIETRLSALENIHLYMHSIRVFKTRSSNVAQSFNVVLYTNSSIQFTYETLKTYLQTFGSPIMATGNLNATTSTTAANNVNKYNATSIVYDSTNDCINAQNSGLNYSVTFTSSTVDEFLDTVIQIF